MSGAEHLAANIIAPLQGAVAVFTTSTTTIVTSLTDSLQLGTAAWSQYLTMQADGGDVYFHFTRTGLDSAAAATVVETAVTGNTRAYKLKDGQSISFRLDHDGTGIAARLHHLCSVAAKKVRIYASSKVTRGIR